MAKELKEYSKEEVATHNKEGDAWIIIDHLIYDVSRFAGMHPGGERELLNFAGKDTTELFYQLHRQEVLSKFGPKLVVGKVKGSKQTIVVPKPGDASPIPWAEASWLQGWNSPYYTEGHRVFAQKARKWYDETFAERGRELEESGEYPTLQDLQKGVSECMIPSMIGAGKHLHGMTIFGVKGEDFDYFHELIIIEMMPRLGLRGLGDGLAGGITIGLPPLINYGTSPIHKQAVQEVFNAQKRICLCITEPYVGSDVAELRCTAKKTPDGKFYIINGVKKWITGGQFADYFTVACRTGGKGAGGISMILVPRTDGVTTKPIKTSYSAAAGTCFVFFEDVKVPVENLLGRENQGFGIIMSNFNHERWVMIGSAQRYTRLAITECIQWASQRDVFGKKLIDQPVIRNKLAHMVARMEAVQAWLEQITYEMCKNGYQNKKVASAIALCKMESTRVSHLVADEAVQIFGGRALTRGGMGKIIENFARTQKFSAILGGSEEILGDMAIRMETKAMPSSKL